MLTNNIINTLYRFSIKKQPRLFALYLLRQKLEKPGYIELAL